ncbi:MAG: rRNA pseudouridine synthase [Ruminococcaceae bacterium]|nr:rRNA pseudouridine synthase [Oscillospiraceae bacterium]
MASVRLDKFVSSSLAKTRSEAHLLIKKGRVELNGKVEKDIGKKLDPENDVVTCEGISLTFSKYHYYMLNKPDGYVCSTEDIKDRTIMELLDEKVRHYNVFPVGRLDKDTLGLVILTDNGALAHFLLSPKRHVDKKYYLETDLPMTEEDVKKAEEGIDIGEKHLTLPAKLEITSDRTKAYITLHEGKFHQIKRMLQALGKTVIYLERIEFDKIKLDPDLKRGELRELTPEETESLLKNMAL